MFLCAFCVSACSINGLSIDKTAYERDLQLAYYDLTPFLGAYYALATTEFQVIDEPQLAQALQQSGAKVCNNPPCAIDAVMLNSFACRSNEEEQDFILLEIKTPLITLQRLYQRMTSDGTFVLAGPVSVYSPYEGVQPLPNATVHPYVPPYLQPTQNTNYGVNKATYTNASRVTPIKPAPASSNDFIHLERGQTSTLSPAHNASLFSHEASTLHSPKDSSQQAKSVLHPIPQVSKVTISTAPQTIETNALEQDGQASYTSTPSLEQNKVLKPATKLDQSQKQEPSQDQDSTIPHRIPSDLPLQTTKNMALLSKVESSVSLDENKALQKSNKTSKIEDNTISGDSAVKAATEVSARGEQEEETQLTLHQVNQEESEVLGQPQHTLVDDLNARIDLYRKEAKQQQQERELAARLNTLSMQTQIVSTIQTTAVHNMQSKGREQDAHVTNSSLSTGEQEPAALSQTSISKQSDLTQAQAPSAAQASDRKVRIIEHMQQFINENYVQHGQIQQPLLFRLKHSTAQSEPQ